MSRRVHRDRSGWRGACLAALAIEASTGFAEDMKPATGDFAFDWLRPRTAACRPLTDAMIARFRRCTQEPGAFGLSDPVFVCRIDDRSEYIVFASAAACLRNLDAMKANAP